MNIKWPIEVASSWMEIVSWGAGILIGAIGVVGGLINFRRANTIRRTELLKSLLDEYNGETVSASLRDIDEGRVTYSNLISLSKETKKSVRLADPALLFFSKVCYLRQIGLISASEFNFFRWKMQKVLSNYSVAEYINYCIENDEKTPYKYFDRYRGTRTLWQKVVIFFKNAVSFSRGNNCLTRRSKQ